MATYDVIRKSDGEAVYSYTADAPVSWDNMGFDTCSHIARSGAGAVAPPRVTKFNGKRHLTKLEFRSLLTPEEQQAIDEFEAQFEASTSFSPDVKRRIRTSIRKREEATFIDLDEPDIAAGLGLYVALGKIAYPRIKEILNG